MRRFTQRLEGVKELQMLEGVNAVRLGKGGTTYGTTTHTRQHQRLYMYKAWALRIQDGTRAYRCIMHGH
jgi:hypothetical protein